MTNETQAAQIQTAEIGFLREATLLSRRWRARLDEALKPIGLTLARSTVIYWLSEAPQVMTQRELAELVGIEGPTLVRQLHALEELGLIRRVPMPGDRRAKGIELTDAALPLVAQILEVSNQIVADTFSRLDKRRLPSAMRFIAEARSALE